MIKYNIVVTPEPVHTHTPTTTAWGNPFPAINSQADLDKWRKDTAFSIGKYVSYGRVMTEHQLRSVYQIVGHVEDYDLMTRTPYSPYNPRVIWKQAICPDESGKSKEAVLDDVRGMYILQEEEINKFVKPYLDSLRNHSTASA